MNISPTIQARVRQILGLTGGPGIEAIEAIQPVVMVAGSLDSRQPQLEAGDQLVRQFVGGSSKGAVGGSYSIVGIRAGATDTLLWIKRIAVSNNTGAAIIVAFGRATNVAAAAFGTAGYVDLRLPGNDIALGGMEVHNASQPGFPISTGRRDMICPNGVTTIRDVDYILTYGGGEGFLVTTVAFGTALTYVSFEGIAYAITP